jgi:predicted DNA-binding ribbon-helix-helix protein
LRPDPAVDLRGLTASHMKTTVQISDALLADIRKIAAKRKTTLKALVNEGLRLVVDHDRKAKIQIKMRDASVGNPGDPWPLGVKSQWWPDP